MARQQKRQPPPILPRRCIFCGGGGVLGNRMSEEHLWSDWMRSLFPSWKSATRLEGWERYAGKIRSATDPSFQRIRDGAPHRTKIKAVCTNCNNTWMSEIETNTKDILTPLILGNSSLLNAVDQTKLAIWIALKILVSEHNSYPGFPAEPIFSQDVRSTFKEKPHVPDGFKIYISSQVGGQNSMLRFYRHVAGLLWSPTPLTVIDNRRPKNIQTATFGIGKLLIQVLATTDPVLYGMIDLKGPSDPIQLWPITSARIVWPTSHVMTDAEIEGLCRVLETLLASARVLPRPS